MSINYYKGKKYVVGATFSILQDIDDCITKTALFKIDVWGPGTNWYISPRLRRTAFRPSQEDDVVEVNVIWGLKDQDRSSCHFTDFKCKGKTVFDNSFDLNPTECQEAILVREYLLGQHAFHSSKLLGVEWFVRSAKIPFRLKYRSSPAALNLAFLRNSPIYFSSLAILIRQRVASPIWVSPPLVY